MPGGGPQLAKHCLNFPTSSSRTWKTAASSSEINEVTTSVVSSLLQKSSRSRLAPHLPANIISTIVVKTPPSDESW